MTNPKTMLVLYVCSIYAVILYGCFANGKSIFTYLKQTEMPETKTLGLVDKIQPPDHLDAVKMEQDGHMNLEYRKEVFLGHHEEIEKLSEAEQLKKLEEIFYKIDVNSDGAMIKGEISNWIKAKIEEHLKEAIDENKQVFIMLDIDKDGSLTWEEFKTGYLLSLGYSADEIAKGSDSLKFKNEEKDKLSIYHFRWVELEEEPKDNKYNADEFLNFRHPETSKKMMRTMAQLMIERQDQNNDRKLTIDEFARLPGEVEIIPGLDINMDAENAYIAEMRQEFKDIIDANNDGFANEDEMMMYIDPHNLQHANLEAAEIIKAVDTNKDSKVSLEEILQNKDFVLGSKIVDVEKSLHDEF